MKVLMIANASISKKDEKGKKKIKEFISGEEVNVTDKEYAAISQSCITGKELKDYKAKLNIRNKG